MKSLTIAIRGAGEMASGIAHRLHTCHLTRIVMSDIPIPIAVRRNVAFCEAVFEGTMEVEGVRADLIRDVSELKDVWGRNRIGVIVDSEGAFLDELRPDVVIDAIMAKRPESSIKRQDSFSIGVGPGFSAPDRADAVVESNRGHDLGRVIWQGEAEPYSGVPGPTAGYTRERVLRAPHEGTVRTVKTIGDMVKKDDIILYVDQTPVLARIDGVLRGLIRPIAVPSGEKLGDVDPRGIKGNCYTISEKARAIAGGVLEAIMHRFNVECG